MLDLPDAVILQNGDALVLDDGRLVEIVAAPEELAELRCADVMQLARIATQHRPDLRVLLTSGFPASSAAMETLDDRMPQLLMKRDVIPGRENWFDFTVDPQYAGQSFRGQCAHLCGTYHAAMVFSLKVMSASDYTTWVAEQTAAAEAKKNATPPPSAAPDAEAVEIVAEGVQFTTTAVEAPADTTDKLPVPSPNPAR